MNPRIVRLRVSSLPRSDTEFGKSGQTFFSARQTRFGLKTYIPVDRGEIFIILEWDFIGSGAVSGQTLPRLRHAYGEYGRVGAGQYWSPFIDVESYPAIFESFGPTGLPWVRNIQLRWMPLKGATKMTLAMEKPGATGEGGDLTQLVELENVQFRFRTPEVSGNLRRDEKWGHIQLAGIFRRIWWDDLKEDTLDLAGHAVGWGINLTPVFKFRKKDAVKMQFLVGEGIENYINDNTIDVAPELNRGDRRRPIVGKALPVRSASGYVELYRGTWGFIGGYSAQNVDNSDGQAAKAFSSASYATITLANYPNANLTYAVEYQYGRRRNFRDQFRFSDYRLQLTAKYVFSADFRGQ